MRDSAVEQLIFSLREAAKDLNDRYTRNGVVDIVASAAGLAAIYPDSMKIYDGDNELGDPQVTLEIDTNTIRIILEVY